MDNRQTEFLRLVENVYDKDMGHACGGCLHCLLDDKNLEDEHVFSDFYENNVREQNCIECAMVLGFLRGMSETERFIWLGEEPPK